MVDDDRFERVWRSYGATLLRYCCFAANSDAVGEEVAAETLAKFLQKGEVVADEHVEAWLFTVARNACRSHHRHSARRRHLLSEIGRSTPVMTEAQPSVDLITLLEPLPSKQRLAVYLRVVEQRPFAEVARAVHKSEQATKQMVYRALKTLRSGMGERLGTVPQSGDGQNG